MQLVDGSPALKSAEGQSRREVKRPRLRALLAPREATALRDRFFFGVSIVIFASDVSYDFIRIIKRLRDDAEAHLVIFSLSSWSSEVFSPES